MPTFIRARLNRTLTFAASLALVAALPALAQARQVEGTFDKTLKVTGAVQLEVRTGSGSIAVQPGASDSVRVVGQIRARESWMGRGPAAAEKVKRLEANPPIRQTGSTIVIGEIEDPELRENVSINYEVTTPADTRLLSRSGSGAQRIGNLAGPVDASTGSGGIVLGAIGGAVEASTGSGSIEATAVKGSLRAHTGSGSVQARDVAGTIEVETGSGSVTVAQSVPGDVRVSVGSGSVRLSNIQGALRVSGASGGVEVSGTPKGPWEVGTASGGITVTIPDTVAFDLDAKTSSGRIDSRHPVTMTGSVERHQIKGQVRGGGPLVKLRAASGSVHVQ